MRSQAPGDTSISEIFLLGCASDMEASIRRAPTRGPAAQISASFQRMVPALVLQNERVAKALGMRPVDVQTLHLMALHDGPMTPSTVVALAALPPSTVTRVLDRLEARGLVRRIVDSDDQRRFHLELDRDAVAPVRALFNDFAADFHTLTASFSARDQAAIARFMTELVALL